MRRSDQLVDRRIAHLRQADPTSAAALALRHRGVCPACGGRAMTSEEDPAGGMRSFRCLDCRWAASTTEERYRMAPQVGLRQLCEDAAMVGKLAMADRLRREMPQKQMAETREAIHTIPERTHRRKARAEEKAWPQESGSESNS